MATLSNPMEGYYEAVGKRGRTLKGAFASREAAHQALQEAGYAAIWPTDDKMVVFGTSHVRTVYTDTH